MQNAQGALRGSVIGLTAPSPYPDSRMRSGGHAIEPGSMVDAQGRDVGGSGADDGHDGQVFE